MRKWRIEAVGVFPFEIIAVDPTGQLLSQLQKVSRIPTSSGTLEGIAVSVAPTELSYFQGDGLSELAAIRFEVEAEDAQAAIAAATPPIEGVVETLSFQMQQLIPIVQVEALDVTPPVQVDDEREGVLFPFPGGLPLPKFQGSVQMGGVGTAQTPGLAPLETEDPRAEAALGWHLKAMASPFVAEQFMLNWIAIEILWRGSGVSVKAEYTANCGHAIPDCPICSKPTAREVRGASIRAYLETCGLDESTARQLWRIRQMFHGDVGFQSTEMTELPRFVQVVRAVVVAGIKSAVGIAHDDPPLVSAGNLGIGPQMAVGLLRKVSATDISAL